MCFLKRIYDVNAISETLFAIESESTEAFREKAPKEREQASLALRLALLDTKGLQVPLDAVQRTRHRLPVPS